MNREQELDYSDHRLARLASSVEELIGLKQRGKATEAISFYCMAIQLVISLCVAQASPSVEGVGVVCSLRAEEISPAQTPRSISIGLKNFSTKTPSSAVRYHFISSKYLFTTLKRYVFFFFFKYSYCFYMTFSSALSLFKRTRCSPINFLYAFYSIVLVEPLSKTFLFSKNSLIDI